MRSFMSLLARFRSDERGVFAVIFGIMAIVLVAFAGAAVDYTSMETARARAQIALDSAALGLAPTIYDDPTAQSLMADAEALIVERLNDASVEVHVTDAMVDRPNGTLRLTGSITVPMAFVQLVGINSLSATVVSEATKGSINLEVAVALDNTGSMQNYIDDLKVGLGDLIDLVVSDAQEPTYSRMALAPYAAAVSVGDYAGAIRGAVPAPRSLTSADWAETAIDIAGATKARPVVITTSSNHGYATGDVVYINSVRGMTQLNGYFYKVVRTSATKFELRWTDNSNVDGRDYSTYSTSTSDRVRRCIITSCEVVVDATAHGFATNDIVRITGSTNSSLNSRNWQVTRLNANQFALAGTSSTSTTTPLASRGNAYCTVYGCEYYYFRRRSRSDYYTYQITDCVTERARETYSDAPPSQQLLGANYTSNGNCDIDQPITPLTSDKERLHDEAEDMGVHGNTAGHLGTAWAWYLLSPEFGYLWPDAENVPAPYDGENLLKVAIIMTDGAYNQEYCNGVSETTINCNAPDDSFGQAEELCDAMKAQGIIVYTVGFNVSGSSAQDIMEDCASDPSKAFLPESGEELIEDFADIGQNITDLRLSM